MYPVALYLYWISRYGSCMWSGEIIFWIYERIMLSIAIQVGPDSALPWPKPDQICPGGAFL